MKNVKRSELLKAIKSQLPPMDGLTVEEEMFELNQIADRVLAAIEKTGVLSSGRVTYNSYGYWDKE